MLVEEGERAALYFQRKDFEIVRKIKFAPKPNKPRRLDTLSNVLGDVRVGRADADDLATRRRNLMVTIASLEDRLDCIEKVRSREYGAQANLTVPRAHVARLH